MKRTNLLFITKIMIILRFCKMYGIIGIFPFLVTD